MYPTEHDCWHANSLSRATVGAFRSWLTPCSEFRLLFGMPDPLTHSAREGNAGSSEVTNETRVERRLAAILVADVAGYSRLMGQDEEGTLRRLTSHRALVDETVHEFGGRIVNRAGDSVLAEFGSVVAATRCAIRIQERVARANSSCEDNRRLEFRIGLHLGDVMVRDGDLFGDGINVAARLQSLADPGGICVSAKVFEEVESKVEARFTDRGEQHVKNIARPVRIYAYVGSSEPEQVSKKLPPALQLPDNPSIAVLPFTNMSSDPEHDHFADGLVEEIITSLSRAKWFFVIARNSTLCYTGRNVDPKQIGRELGVRYLLQGSLRAAGNRVRISVQLVDAENGTQVWVDRYDRPLRDILDLQDEISSSVSAAIEPQLYAAEAMRVHARPTHDFGAWGCVVQALAHMWRQSEEEIATARNLLERAISLDPNYAKAHALLGWSHCKLFPLVSSGRMREVLDQAYGCARRAVQLDEHEPWAHLVLGVVHVRRKEHRGAIAAIQATAIIQPTGPVQPWLRAQPTAWRPPLTRPTTMGVPIRATATGQSTVPLPPILIIQYTTTRPPASTTPPRTGPHIMELGSIELGIMG